MFYEFNKIVMLLHANITMAWPIQNRVISVRNVQSEMRDFHRQNYMYDEFSIHMKQVFPFEDSQAIMKFILGNYFGKYPLTPWFN